MDKPYCYEYPRPAVTVDVVAFTLREGRLRVLLVRRKSEPFAGRWAIPGGFLEIDEPPDQGARRELREETAVEPSGPLAPIGTFAAVDRDPRGRTISLAYATALRAPGPEPTGADDATEARWIDVASARDLAFDHDEILAAGLAWLRRGIPEGPLGLALLPVSFLAADVEMLFRDVFGSDIESKPWLDILKHAKLIKQSVSHPDRFSPTLDK